MTDLPSLFSDVAAAAMALDHPDAIRATIRSTVDDGLRATRHDGPGGRSSGGDTHPERQALKPRRDPSWADLAAVDHHEARFVGAIAELAVRSHSRGAPDTWDEAVPDAHLLATMVPNAIEVLDRTGQRPARWVHQAGDAVHDLEAIIRRHLPREAAEYEKSWTSGLADEECCRLCLAHVNLRVERKAKGLCQMHLRLHNDADGIDPPEWLTEEYRRIGSPAGPDWKRARSRWLTEIGVKDSA